MTHSYGKCRTDGLTDRQMNKQTTVILYDPPPHDKSQETEKHWQSEFYQELNFALIIFK